jgi:hypothetical protein
MQRAAFFLCLFSTIAFSQVAVRDDYGHEVKLE